MKKTPLVIVAVLALMVGLLLGGVAVGAGTGAFAKPPSKPQPKTYATPYEIMGELDCHTEVEKVDLGASDEYRLPPGFVALSCKGGLTEDAEDYYILVASRSPMGIRFGALTAFSSDTMHGGDGTDLPGGGMAYLGNYVVAIGSYEGAAKSFANLRVEPEVMVPAGN